MAFVPTPVIKQQDAWPCCNVELTIKAKNLRDRDLLSKSDPLCIVYALEGGLVGNTNPQWVEKGRTEQLMNTLNPEWATKIVVPYYFEERQRIRFDIYDIDSNSVELDEHDFLAMFECDLAEIVGSNRSTLAAELKGRSGRSRSSTSNRRYGEITVEAEEIDEGHKEIIQFRLRAEKLDRKDWFGKSDPFLNLYRVNDDGTRTLAHRTEWIRHTLNPTWQLFEVNLKNLCNGRRTDNFVIECLDYDEDGGHDMIGVAEANIDSLQRGMKTVALINEKKRLRKGARYKSSGTLIFDAVTSEHCFSFVDFISGGCQLEFSVAIDFTASNGPPDNPRSLHYLYNLDGRPNQYELAIQAVLSICSHYNSSQKYASFGFGAKTPPHAQLSHCFSMRSPIDNRPELIGAEGVLAAYRHILPQLQLFGPTNFAPSIRAVSERAKTLPIDGSRYMVMLIVTDGAISDMAVTKSAIIEASTLPLSIIIVGVGADNFENMHELDGDGPQRRLTHNGRSAARDIVQFVAVRDFLDQARPILDDRALARLDKELLAEIPAQLTGWMRSRRIVPRSRDDPFPRDPPPPPLYPAHTTAPYSVTSTPQLPENAVTHENYPTAPPLLPSPTEPVGFRQY